MKRFTTLALVVFALAAVPAAFADDTTPPARPADTTATAPTTRRSGRTAAKATPGCASRSCACAWRSSSSASGCTAARTARLRRTSAVARAEQMLARLQKIDANVQAKLAELKACTPDSTDAKCKNAARKIAVLTKLDTRLQNAIQKLQDYLDGKSTHPDRSLERLGARPGCEPARSGRRLERLSGTHRVRAWRSSPCPGHSTSR